MTDAGLAAAVWRNLLLREAVSSVALSHGARCRCVALDAIGEVYEVMYAAEGDGSR